MPFLAHLSISTLFNATVPFIALVGEIPPPTVGQEAVESICQSERKTQQNATISLWPLFSAEMDLGLKKS